MIFYKLYIFCLSLAGSLQNLPVGSGYFEITCNANPSDHTSAVRWTKNGQPFRFNPNNPYVYFTNDNRKIIFESLTPNDNGIYTCYMNDTAHSSSSTDLFIENASTCFEMSCNWMVHRTMHYLSYQYMTSYLIMIMMMMVMMLVISRWCNGSLYAREEEPCSWRCSRTSLWRHFLWPKYQAFVDEGPNTVIT